MDSVSSPSFHTIIKKFSKLPLWVKQVFYLQLKEEFENASILDSLNLFDKENCLQLYVPKLTFLGKKELNVKTKGLPANVYILLEECPNELSIIEIAAKNNWSLAECAGYFMTALNLEFVEEPESACIKGTAMYLCDLIRIGEFFVKLGKIDVMQLGESLKAQKYIEETLQDKLKIGKILIDLGLATTNEIEGVFALKEESKKKFSPDLFAGAGTYECDSLDEDKLFYLEKENKKLKDQLNKLLNIKRF